MLMLIQPKYLPITIQNLHDYEYESLSFLEQVNHYLFKNASSMQDAFDQNNLIILINKISDKTISDNEIIQINNLLERHGFLKWIFNRNKSH